MAIATLYQANYLNICCITGIICTTLFLTVRLYIRRCVSGPIGWDDAASVIGSVICIAQTATTLYAIHNGLGSPQSSLSFSDINIVLQLNYIANILYILSTCFAKLSLILLIARLCVFTTNIRLCVYLMAFTCVWALGSILAIAFQCNLPQPWNILGQCQYIISKWITIETIGLLIELLICAIVVHLVWHLALAFRTKLAVVAAFSTQILVIIPVVFRIYYIKTFPSVNVDITSNLTNIVLCTQIAMHFSSMAATFPCLRQLIQCLSLRIKAAHAHDIALEAIDTEPSESSIQTYGSETRVHRMDEDGRG